jgi:SNF2 family DNA or RNA helicase
VDESTKFKHANTQRFKCLKQILDAFSRRYILTGKPVPNGVMDLFGQIYILDLGKRLGAFITHYRNKYFFQTGFGGYTWRPVEGASEQIEAKIVDITMRLDKRDHLKDLPPYVENIVKVALPHAAMDAYRELEREFILRLAEGEVLALNAASATAKLRQMTSGAVYLDGEDRMWGHVHDAKLDALDALLAEREGSPTLVAYQFNHTADRIRTEFKDAVILSRLADKKAERALEAWNRGDIELLLVHPASAAHGLNLQGGSESLVWFDPTYDLEHDDQLLARLWRSGQKKTVVNHRILAEGTIDEAIVSALRGKDRSQNQFLAALKAHFKKEIPRVPQETEGRGAKHRVHRTPQRS